METILAANIKKFKYRKDTDTILKRIDLVIESGTINVFMGDSGSGKSTLLQLLSGILPFFNPGHLEGKITFKNNLITHTNINKYVECCSFLSQNPEQNIIFTTVEDELIYNLEKKNIPRGEIKNTLNQFVEYFSLKKILKSNIEELSQGQKQLISLAASLVTTPNIIFLDEPTSMLDYHNTELFCRVIKRIKILYPDITFLITTHKEELSKAISTNEYIIQEGTVVSTKTNVPNYKYIVKSNNYKLYNEKYTINRGGAPVINVEGLSFYYDKEETILKNINFKLMKGEILWISGPNGGGKSTLLLLISGLLKPKDGAVFFKSAPIKNYKEILPKHVGFILQNPDHQIMSSSVREELSLVFKCMDIDSEFYDPIVEEGLLKLNQLTTMSTKDPREASFGQKKMISILSYLNDLDVLILDEPDLALDHKNMNIMIDLLNSFRAQGTSIIIVSHNFHIMTRFSERLIYLDKTILFDGLPDNFDQENVENRYL